MKKKYFLFLFILITINSKAQVLASQNFNSSIGWTYNSVTNGQTGVVEPGWLYQANGINPNCSPSSGSGMACFVAHNVLGNTIAGLYSPPITFSGLNYRLRFKMFRISASSGTSNEINVYINSTNSLTGATLLTTFKPFINQSPSVPENGWYECYVNLPAGTTGSKNIIFRGKANVGFGDNVYIDEVFIEQTPLVDASLETFNMSSNILSGTKTIAGKFCNRGVTTINSINVNWQENNGTVHTQSLTGLNLTSGQTYNYSHSINWNATPQQSVFKVWLSNINGGVTDNYMANNEIIKSINIYSSYFSQNIVYEVMTGTWCGYCPKSIVALKNMHHYNTDGSFIGIAVHNGDQMELVEYSNAMDGFSTSTPNGVFNRNNGNIIYPNYLSVNQFYQSEKLKIPFAKINLINGSWNSTTRQISVETEVKFALNLQNINYNVSVVVLENDVTGTSTQYNQHNYYSGNTDVIDWEGINWKNLPSLVLAPSMHYDYVARALLGGFNGLSGIVPNSVVFETPYNHIFTHTLPINQNVNNISLVALLIDSTNGRIVNATKTSLNALSINNFEKSAFNFYPNPSSGVINFETLDGNLIIEIFDILGKKVYFQKKNNDSTVDLSFLQKGIYSIKITTENATDVQKLILK